MTGPGEMPKTYSPEAHEGSIRERWEAAGAFHADPAKVLRGEKPPYAILIPPPNVTAALHLGHALNNTLQDILARAHRMKGFETLWMPGTDHAGIATQTVVDKRLQTDRKPALKEHKEMEARGEPGRERFIAIVQAWKDQYEARITDQLKKMGCSCDWDRQRFTMDEFCARAVRHAFFRLFKDGLIYRGKRLVNWDPVTQTALADDEVEMKEVDGAFYYLRYPLFRVDAAKAGGLAPNACASMQNLPDDAYQPVTWSELAARGYPGADERPDDEPAWITVATTRPETYLGDTGVAIHPRDPRAKALEGLRAELPLIGRLVPIVQDDYVVLPADLAELAGVEIDPASEAKSKMATGFLKVTPAHDPNDWAIGERRGLEVINVLAPDASISDTHGWERQTRGEGGEVFLGLSREEARRKVVDEFKARTVGAEPLLEKVTPNTHSVGHSYRSHAQIEPYLSDQWYVHVTDDRLRGEAQRALVREQRSEGSRGGTGLRPVPEWADTQERLPIFRPAGFVGHDPYPPGEPSPSNLIKQVRDLPHVMVEGATYFVTWRTATGQLSEVERAKVLESIAFWHGSRWQVFAACVMPDHVHLVARPFDGESLSELVAGVKKNTALQINRDRGVDGKLWQAERFDHIIRNELWLAAFVEYVILNPVRAELCNAPSEYRWTLMQGEVLDELRTAVHQRTARRAVPPGSPSDATLQESSGDGDGAMRFYPSRYAKTYETWHDNLRDWCISRQLWWGHRIPVWKLRDDYRFPADSKFDLTKSLGILAEWIEQDRIAVTAFGHRLTPDGLQIDLSEPNPNSEVCVCVADPFDAEIVAQLESNGFEQDPDVLDTWFSSALWPLSTMGWPGGLPPAITPEAIDPEDPGAIRSVWVKRVGSFSRFIGEENTRSGELIERLLNFRDIDPARALKYQLFDASNLASPLIDSTAIAEAEDLVCAVGVRRTGEFRTQNFGVMNIEAWLGSHGFCRVDRAPTTDLLDAFNPTGVLCTAREIITLWVSRMVMFNRYFLAQGDNPGRVPFRDVFIHAMIQDGEGRKMSKSLGNGVDPLDIIHSHGADAMRFTLCQMTTQTQDVRMPVVKDPETHKNTSPKFDNGRNFCNKLWNASRFTMSMLQGKDAHGDPADPASLSLADRWILGRLASAADTADHCLQNYEFSLYAQTVYDLVWRDFCDWYLEAIKPTIGEDDAQRAVLRSVFDAILRLLHPIAPFITEAIFERLHTVPSRGVAGLTLAEPEIDNLLCRAGWPEADPSLRDAQADADFELMRGVVSAVREVRAQHKVAPKRAVTLHLPPELLEKLERAGASPLVCTLANVASITSGEPEGPSVECLIGGRTARLSDLADEVDAEAERERLLKQIADLRKSIGALEGRLANPGYANKAPAHLVQQTRDQLDDTRAELHAAQSALERLG